MCIRKKIGSSIRRIHVPACMQCVKGTERAMNVASIGLAGSMKSTESTESIESTESTESINSAKYAASMHAYDFGDSAPNTETGDVPADGANEHNTQRCKICKSCGAMRCVPWNEYRINRKRQKVVKTAMEALETHIKNSASLIQCEQKWSSDIQSYIDNEKDNENHINSAKVTQSSSESFVGEDITANCINVDIDMLLKQYMQMCHRISACLDVWCNASIPELEEENRQRADCTQNALLQAAKYPYTTSTHQYFRELEASFRCSGKKQPIGVKKYHICCELEAVERQCAQDLRFLKARLHVSLYNADMYKKTSMALSILCQQLNRYIRATNVYVGRLCEDMSMHEKYQEDNLIVVYGKLISSDVKKEYIDANLQCINDAIESCLSCILIDADAKLEKYFNYLRETYQVSFDEPADDLWTIMRIESEKKRASQKYINVLDGLIDALDGCVLYKATCVVYEQVEDMLEKQVIKYINSLKDTQGNSVDGQEALNDMALMPNSAPLVGSEGLPAAQSQDEKAHIMQLYMHLYKLYKCSSDIIDQAEAMSIKESINKMTKAIAAFDESVSIAVEEMFADISQINDSSGMSGY